MNVADEEYQGWVAVTRAMEPAAAEAKAAQLRALGIPARVEQEGAGKAMGLSIGKLGDATVTVPAWLESEATYAVEHAEVEEPVVSRSTGREPERDAFSRVSRAMLVVAAVAFSPFAVALTLIFALANRLRGK